MEMRHLRNHPHRQGALTAFNDKPPVDIETDALARAIVETVREPLLILNKDLRVLTASPSFYSAFSTAPSDVEGRLVFALDDGHWNIPELRLLLNNIAPQHAIMEAYEIEHEFPRIGKRTLLLNARKVFNDRTFGVTILLAIENITERRASEREQQPMAIVVAKLQASRARERALLQKARNAERDRMLETRELEHRLGNGLQLISSLLSVQSRSATTPEVSAQLANAAMRVASLGRVHHQLHVLDHQDRVEFKQYLEQLCADLSRLLCDDSRGFAIGVSGNRAEIATAVAIPLGFIVNELVTNSVKYAKSNVTVRFETSAAGHSLSVEDEGPGIPAGFEPAHSKGLGMRIVLSQLKQIGGQLRIEPGSNGHGTRFTVTFPSS